MHRVLNYLNTVKKSACSFALTGQSAILLTIYQPGEQRSAHNGLGVALLNYGPVAPWRVRLAPQFWPVKLDQRRVEAQN